MSISKLFKRITALLTVDHDLKNPDNPEQQQRASEPTSHPEVNTWQRYFILSLDGGGIRGLSTLYLLEALMNKIGKVEREYDQNATHSFYPDEFIEPRGSETPNDASYAYRYFPCHYFDGIFGTSTGGLIAIMLGRLRMNVKDSISEFIKFGGQVFGHPRRAHLRGQKRSMTFNPLKDKFHVAPLRDAINRIVDERDPFSQNSAGPARKGKAILRLPQGLCQTAVFAVEGSCSAEGWLFRSYDHPQSESYLQRDQTTSQYKIETVACATTAAPTYFKPTKVDHLIFYDGGLGANNPCSLAMEEVRDLINTKYHAGADEDGYLGVAVSIGTGKVARQNLKPPKSWLGRYAEAVGWEQRRADNSSSTHRDMSKFTRRTSDHLEKKGIMNTDPLHFKYHRFTVGRHREPPEDEVPVVLGDLADRVDRMAHMKMDEWIPGDDPDATVAKIRDATHAWLESAEIQDEMSELARLLVDNRRKRARCDQSATMQTQSNSQESAKWYRYATASHLVCCCNGCDTLFYSQSTMRDHVESKHGKPWAQRLAKRVVCSHEQPATLA